MRASWWAIDRLGNADYTMGGSLHTEGVGDIPAGKYKCNAFVGNSYAVGAELGWGDDSYPVNTTCFGLRTSYPVTANDMADSDYDMGNIGVVEWGHLRTGDIYAWSHEPYGHCDLYIGMGVSISASPSGVRLADMRKLQSETPGTTYRRYKQ